jgi:hypothetical protein
MPWGVMRYRERDAAGGDLVVERGVHETRLRQEADAGRPKVGSDGAAGGGGAGPRVLVPHVRLTPFAWLPHHSTLKCDGASRL